MLGHLYSGCSRSRETKRDRDICNIGPEFLASTDKVEAYLNRNLNPPPLELFQPYFDNVQHPWNYELAKKFADCILSEYCNLQSTSEDVKDYFIQHLTGLNKLLVKQLPRNTDKTTNKAMKHYSESHA